MKTIQFKEEQIYSTGNDLLCDDTCKAIRAAIAQRSVAEQMEQHGGWLESL